MAASKCACLKASRTHWELGTRNHCPLWLAPSEVFKLHPRKQVTCENGTVAPRCRNQRTVGVFGNEISVWVTSGGLNILIKTFSLYLILCAMEESIFISLLLCCCCGFSCFTHHWGITMISPLQVPGCSPSPLLGLGTGTWLLENPSPSKHCLQSSASPVSYWWQLLLLSFIKVSFHCLAKQSCCKGYRWKRGKEVNAICYPCWQEYVFLSCFPIAEIKATSDCLHMQCNLDITCGIGHEVKVQSSITKPKKFKPRKALSSEAGESSEQVICPPVSNKKNALGSMRL